MFSDDDRKNILEIKKKIREKVSFGSLAVKKYIGDYLNIAPFPTIFLSGGAIASLVQNEEPKDWDIFFFLKSEQESFTQMLTSSSYFTDVKIDVNYVDDDGIPKNALTIKTDDISFVTLHHGLPSEVKKTFDFLHCTSHYDIMKDSLHISELQYKCMKEKLLMKNNENLVHKWRLDKFLARGYRIAHNHKFDFK